MKWRSIQKRVACQTGLPIDEFNQLKNSLHKLVETMHANEPIDIKSAA